VSLFLLYLSSMQSASFLPAVYGHVWPVWLYHLFPHYLINSAIFGKNVFEHKMCIVIFSTTCVKNTSHSLEEFSEVLSWMCISLNVKYPLFLSHFNGTWIFFTEFRKSSNIKFYEICPVGAKLFHADGRTDRHDKANSHFSQFYERT